jgi:hypothetical protein
LIEKNHPKWKKATWQKMLLGSYIKKIKNLSIDNICYLDTDILINTNSPNIFKYQKKNKIGLVSETFNMPFNLDKVRRKVSFYRNKYYSKKYKLDSSLFMSVKQKYLFQKLKPQKDYACAGLILFNINKFSNVMRSWFFKYDRRVNTLTGGGDEPIMNFEIFNSKKYYLLDYKFQALWLYEMANNYSFLYKFKNKKNKIIKNCIEETISNNFFLHFPGKWYEGTMWKIKGIMQTNEKIKDEKNINKYFKMKLSGKATGRILP